MKDVRIAMVALGGYANFYLEHLFKDYTDQTFRLVAGIDPNPVGCRYLDRFETYDIPIYPDLDSFFAEGEADLVMIAAPIHLHARFTCQALAHGASVLCEKPVAPTIQEVRQMAEAEARADGFVAIGYQWSYSAAIQALKRDVIGGALGAPRRFCTKVLWPRPLSYYRRNSWAGALKASDGSWILDSPANNATAHYLHNCFYVLGATRESSARPVDVQAELYRANDIENYDTAAIRSHTEHGVEILFYTAHPVPEVIGPTLRYEFESAVVEFDVGDSRLVAHFEDGRVKDYGDPFANGATKIWQAMDAVRTGMPPACGVEAAASHTLCINGAQESRPPRAAEVTTVGEVVDFPASLVRRRAIEASGRRAAEAGGDALIWVDGLHQTLERCYEEGVMPAELPDVNWAQHGMPVGLESYTHFPRL